MNSDYQSKCFFFVLSIYSIYLSTAFNFVFYHFVSLCRYNILSRLDEMSKQYEMIKIRNTVVVATDFIVFSLISLLFFENSFELSHFKHLLLIFSYAFLLLTCLPLPILMVWYGGIERIDTNVYVDFLNNLCNNSIVWNSLDFNVFRSISFHFSFSSNFNIFSTQRRS